MFVVEILFVAASVIVLCFGFVLLFGAPFLPTLKPQIDTALDLLDLAPGQTMLELGSGDGRVLIAAARRGLNAVGYELNPILVLVSRLTTWRYRRQVSIIWGDYWRSTWPRADGIFSFILPRYMKKLHNKVIQYPYKPLRVASFAFAIPGANLLRAEQGVFLYGYKYVPAEHGASEVY